MDRWTRAAWSLRFPKKTLPSPISALCDAANRSTSARPPAREEVWSLDDGAEPAVDTRDTGDPDVGCSGPTHVENIDSGHGCSPLDLWKSSDGRVERRDAGERHRDQGVGRMGCL